jgi:hypothetical protein
VPSIVPVKDIDNDKITSNNKDDNDDDDDNVGGFNNEVEGGVPCAPHSIFIKKLHNLNQTPTYQRNDIKKEEINLLIKKLLNMKSRGELAESCAVQAPVGRTKKKRLKNTKLVGWLDSEIIL